MILTFKSKSSSCVLVGLSVCVRCVVAVGVCLWYACVHVLWMFSVVVWGVLWFVKKEAWCVGVCGTCVLVLNRSLLDKCHQSPLDTLSVSVCVSVLVVACVWCVQGPVALFPCVLGCVGESLGVHVCVLLCATL